MYIRRKLYYLLGYVLSKLFLVQASVGDKKINNNIAPPPHEYI